MRKKKLPKIPEGSNFNLRISTGEKEYFVNRTSRGFVLGPRNPELKSGLDDHLTIGEDAKGNFQIHRTVDDAKIWWHNQDSMKNEFRKTWARHTEVLDSDVLERPDTHLISFRRVMAAFSSLSPFITFATWLFGRMVPSFDVVEVGENRYAVLFGIDKARTIHMARAMTAPLVLALRVTSKLPKRVPERIIKIVSRFFIIDPTDSKRLAGDFEILLSPERAGFLMPSATEKFVFTSFAVLGELYGNVEKNIPFGKLSELGHVGEQTKLDLRVKPKDE